MLRDIILFFIVFSIAILLHFVGNEFYDPMIRLNPESMTNYILNIVARVINEQPCKINSDSSRETLRKIIVENGLNNYLPNVDWRPEKYFKVKNNAYDFWGKPLNIEFLNNFPVNIRPKKFTPLKHNLLVWSSGKNGIDEWGQGDDIVYYESSNVEFK